MTLINSPIPSYSTSGTQHVYPSSVFVNLHEAPMVNFDNFSSSVSSEALNFQLNLRDKIQIDRKKYIEDIRGLSKDRDDSRKKIEDLERQRQDLLKNENLNHLINRVNEEGVKKLRESKDFQNKFDMGNTYNMVVLSLDIRRSTELMLKSKSPTLYAQFITSLCIKLSAIIKNNYGVLDRFTGDGILAFFPDFYSGSDMIYYALKSAYECHEYFNVHYKSSRNCFITVFREVGLGIGIDYGEAYLANVNNELTIVGTPVVYACRMSGAKYGETLLNQTAFELLSEKYSKFFEYSETDIDIKNEGSALAYKVNFNFRAVEVSKPDWVTNKKKNNNVNY